MVIARVAHTGGSTYVFMLWNLVLAWIPLILARGVYLLVQDDGSRALAVLLGLLWLLFFPNAAYMLTDFLHLIGPRADAPGWYDMLLLAWFGWVGFLLAIAALMPMQSVVEESRGLRAGWVMVVAVVLLAGVGVYIGRFVQWNSWDVISSPQAVLVGISGGVAHPLRLVGFSTLFSLLFLVVYCAFRTLPRAWK